MTILDAEEINEPLLQVRVRASEAIRQFAEEPYECVPEPSPPTRRIRTPSFTLMLSPAPTLSVVTSVRTSASELDRTIAEVRRLVTDSGYTRTVWTIGPSCRPDGIASLLAARGFAPSSLPPVEPESFAMALVEPPPAPGGAEIRFPRDFADYLEALRISAEAFELSEEDAAGWRAAAESLWRQQDGVNQFTHLALLDGRPVGFSFALTGTSGLFLCGSGVLPEARGRGAYRALVRARWEDAVTHGTPALITQAGRMSAPILLRLGFEEVARIHILIDRFGE
jgi:GNAT superfamily N-acetyltransferase